jgi:hypothetical protein
MPTNAGAVKSAAAAARLARRRDADPKVAIVVAG